RAVRGVGGAVAAADRRAGRAARRRGRTLPGHIGERAQRIGAIAHEARRAGHLLGAAAVEEAHGGHGGGGRHGGRGGGRRRRAHDAALRRDGGGGTERDEPLAGHRLEAAEDGARRLAQPAKPSSDANGQAAASGAKPSPLASWSSGTPAQAASMRARSRASRLAASATPRQASAAQLEPPQASTARRQRASRQPSWTE